MLFRSSFFVSDSIPEIYSYFVNIVIGVSIVNCIRPISSYLILKYDAKKFFLFCTLPTGISTLIVYFIFAQNWGALGIAQANIVSYSLWAVMQIFLLTKTNFKLNFHVFKSTYD